METQLQFWFIAGIFDWVVFILYAEVFSAGVGRTGTIIAVNHIREMLKQGVGSIYDYRIF